MLITGHKYRIGKKVYEVVMEDMAEDTCFEQCDIEDCRTNKEFLQFMKDCKADCCLTLLGVGRCFEQCEP